MRTDFGYFEEENLGKPYDIRLLRRLYPLSQPYRKLLGVSISLVILITLLDLSLLYITKIVVDRYIVPTQDAFASGREATGQDSVARARGN